MENRTPNSTTVNQVRSVEAVRGIDTLRFFAAVWVVLYHMGPIPIQYLFPDKWRPFIMDLSRLPFNGVAAVVVFFVVSGFCIHFPNVYKENLDWRRFLVQRALRIIPPLTIAIAICEITPPEYYLGLKSVLWSIYCEIIYYILYPILFLFFRRRLVVPVLICSFVVSLAIAIAEPRTIFLWELGDLTWLFCLPIWLTGCTLADRYRHGSFSLPEVSVWIWRSGIVALGSLAAILSHLPAYKVGYIWTMPILGILCFPWILSEITSAKRGAIYARLERLGAAGYSIYLMHKIAIVGVGDLGVTYYAIWPLGLCAVVILSSLFYMVVERPSHICSKWIGRLMRDGRYAHAAS